MSLFNTVDLEAQLYSTTVVDHKPVLTPVGVVDDFTGTMQPTTGQALQVLPESLRSVISYSLITNYDIIPKGDKSKDFHSIFYPEDGKTYKAVYKYPWKNQIIPHNRYIVQELKEND